MGELYLNFEQEEPPARAQSARAVGVCAWDGFEVHEYSIVASYDISVRKWTVQQPPQRLIQKTAMGW